MKISTRHRSFAKFVNDPRALTDLKIFFISDSTSESIIQFWSHLDNLSKAELEDIENSFIKLSKTKKFYNSMAMKIFLSEHSDFKKLFNYFDSFLNSRLITFATLELISDVQEKPHVSLFYKNSNFLKTMMTQFINWITTNSSEVKNLRNVNLELHLVIAQLKEENKLLKEEISGKIYDV